MYEDRTVYEAADDTTGQLAPLLSSDRLVLIEIGGVDVAPFGPSTLGMPLFGLQTTEPVPRSDDRMLHELRRNN